MLEINIDGDTRFSMCKPSGEIDAYTVDEFRDALSSLATVSKLLIDLSEVPFMDSAGLGALIGSIRKAGENDGQIVVACGRESLLGLLKTTGFDQIVTVTESVNEALDVLGESQDI
jgi:anti-sigma B factor antagonist|tara:strand:+ start:315 stop:662 length:348 start_codon:yes stop_codon:yes gene_type:complete